MSTRSGPVVVGIDGSPGADAALEWATAEAHARGSELRVVFAFGNQYTGAVGLYGRVPLPDRARVVAAGERVLDAALNRVGELDPDLEVGGDIIDEAPARALIAESKDAALVVIGSRGLKALGSAVLGSVGSAVAARAHCPVVVVRGPAGLPEENASVVVGVDAEGTAAQVLEFAFDYASQHELRLRAVLCWHRDPIADLAWHPQPSPPPQAEMWLSEALAGWRERYPDVVVREEVIRDQPAIGLAQVAMAQYLLVVGSRGRSALAGTLLGSVSQGVLHHATCPVAVVPVGEGD